MKNSIPYTFKQYKNSKTIRIRIRSTGEVFVSAPYGLNKSHIEKFIQEKSSWIEEKISIFKSLPQPHIKTKSRDYKKYKEQARKLVHFKIEKINSFYKFKFNKIFIKNQKTRWGSCSNNKNLNFNYKIIFLPDRLCEYIIAHELCHLREMNHGRRFWDLVMQTIPDHEKVQAELKDFRIK